MILQPNSLRTNREGAEAWARTLLELVRVKVRQRELLPKQIDDLVSELEELGARSEVIEAALVGEDLPEPPTETAKSAHPWEGYDDE